MLKDEDRDEVIEALQDWMLINLSWYKPWRAVLLDVRYSKDPCVNCASHREISIGNYILNSLTGERTLKWKSTRQGG